MNIILGEENVQNVDGKYTVLEMDTFRIGGHEVKSYCLVENLPLNEVMELPQYLDLHRGLIRNYQKQNWDYCEQALEHLRGKWNCDLDSFYQMLAARIAMLKEIGPGPNWDPVIGKD